MSARRRFAVLAACLLPLFGVVPVSAETPTLRVAEMWEMPTLDPLRDATLIKEKAMVTETLVTGLPDFTIAPGLALSWRREGETLWRFALRPGVRFHDGSPLTAQAVVASLEHGLRNSPSIRHHTRIASVAVAGEGEVAITTVEPFPALPAALVYAAAGIVAMSSPGAPDGTIDRPIGTGPYRVADWDPAGQRLTVTRFEDYWGEAPAIAAISFRSIPDPATRALELRKGGVDFAADVPYGDLDGLAAKGFTVSRSITARNYMLSFGSLKATPFADPRVRKALSLAIDRDEIARYVLFGMGRAGIAPFPDTMAFADPAIAVPKADPAAARALLAEAGYAPGADGVMAREGRPLAFTLYTYAQRPGLVPMAGAIQAQLRRIGVAVTIRVAAYEAIAREMKPGDARLAALATAAYPDPDVFLRQTYHSQGATNSWGYADARVDAALAEALTAPDEAARLQAYRRVQRIVADDEPCLVIAHYGVNVAMRPGIENYRFNPIAHDYMLEPHMRLSPAPAGR